MKKCISVIMAFCLMLTFAPVCFAETDSGTDLKITSATQIVIAADATEQENFAAERLSYYLGLVFGTAPSVVTSASENAIYIGSASNADTSSLEENGYIITVTDGKVQIAGTGIRGTIQGVYRFLEEFADVHNYTSEIVSAPSEDSITVPADTNITYAPYFEFTETDWRSPKDVEYSVFNGITGNTYRNIPAEQGGCVKYLSGACHTLTTQFCKAADYFESHPEYFALHNGERTGDQLCLSNPDTIETVKNEVLDLLKDKYVDDGSLQIVSVSQNDNQNYCQCSECAAYDEAHGGVHSATLVRFTNEIARAVKEAGYEYAVVDTFAYQYTRHAPTGIIPDDNVIIRMCTIEGCFRHTLDNPDCPQNASMMTDLENWSEICNRLYIWDYATNYANTICVFPDFGVIQRNMQIFYEHNVKGVYEEGNYYIDSCDTEFGELRSYMIAKFMQDPYADFDEVVNGFISAYYGTNARLAMRKIIDMYIAHAGEKNKHLGIYYESFACFNMSDADVYYINRLWEGAKNAEGITETQRNNILRSEISWRWYKACTRRGEFSLLNSGRFDEKEKLYDDIIAAGVTCAGEGRNLGMVEKQDYIRYSTPDEWTNRYAPETQSEKNALVFFGGILEMITPVLSGFGIFYRLSNLFCALSIK